MTKPPAAWPLWTDEDAVYARVQGELQEPDRLDALFVAENWDLMPDRTWADIRREGAQRARGREQEALDAWRRGDRKPLGELVNPDDDSFNEMLERLGRPPLRKDRLISRQFSAETWAIIRDSLLGKLSGKRGRPKMTNEERREHNPLHDAADMVPSIESILHQRYPDQSARQLKDRAHAFAERLMGIDDPDSAGSKVSKHLERSKKDRGRLA
ncbi:hypothetical protein [Bradyrhizobium elkanii]|uniref:hypothetical protein n=1 Tax=Bradyrhizobium elkanii TaxID=29448 RepID=UPI00216715AC|nr:hypothetical protein [Bradyrhizobium elkanii]MCS3521849.1 hypothetical protein [Bradyrhizobium elkanii]MCS4069504.1 hypothetical protein [Bradyrhizobium elkanii]MCS4076134.1 hypothetical protein [Bradyrhizobium elkanii]MDH6687738.1 hypothetical protein [Bradyrhizobium elkanii]